MHWWEDARLRTSSAGLTERQLQRETCSQGPAGHAPASPLQTRGQHGKVTQEARVNTSGKKTQKSLCCFQAFAHVQLEIMWISLDGETTGTRKTPSSSSSSSSEPPRGGTFLHTRLRGSSEGKRQRGINVLVPWTLLYKDPVWERRAHDQRAWTFSGRGRQRPPGYTAAYHCAVLSGFGHRALITPLNTATFNHLCGLVMNIWGCRSWDLWVKISFSELR